MAYISQDDKKAIAPGVKAVLKKYGVKASLSINNHSTIVATLKSGPIDFREGYVAKGAWTKSADIHNGHQVNHYWIDDNYAGKAKSFLSELIEALRGKKWFDKSDMMTDYHYVSHYTGITVGAYKKPYTLTA